MATAENIKKLQQDILNEITTTKQLLYSISVEVQKIKDFTCPEGEFVATIKQNASLMEVLGNMQQLNLDNIPPVART